MATILKVSKKNIPACHTKTRTGKEMGIICIDADCLIKENCGFIRKHFIVLTSDI